GGGTGGRGRTFAHRQRRYRHERLRAAQPRVHLPAGHRPPGGTVSDARVQADSSAERPARARRRRARAAGEARERNAVKRVLPLLLAVAVTTGVTAAVPASAAPRGDGLGHCTGGVCSFDVPPGTYRLTLVLGSRTAAAGTGVEVEARRTVVAPVATRAGRTVTRAVDVDVRTPESMPDGQEGNGTPGLQVYLTGGDPALTSIQVTSAPAVRRLFVVSDSTAAAWLYGPKRGWAQELPQLLGPGVAVANWGDSGSAAVSWLSNPSLFAALEPH